MCACMCACVRECMRVSYVVDDEGPLLVLVVGVARVAEQGRRDRDVLGNGPDDEATLGVLYARHPLVALQQQRPALHQCSSRVGKRAGCKRIWAQSSLRTTEIRAQFSAQTTQNLLRVNDQNLVLWAIDENMGTNLQAFYKHFYISCLKTQKQQLHFVKINNFFFFLNLFYFVIRAGRV